MVRYNCVVEVDCPFSIDIDPESIGSVDVTNELENLVSHISEIHELPLNIVFKTFLIDARLIRCRDDDTGHLIPIASPRDYNPGRTPASGCMDARSPRYCCPLQDCTFSIAYSGLHNGEAFSHIYKTHQVTAEDMNNAPQNYYKFKKVEAETLSDADAPASTDSGLQCDMCSASVIYGEDYIAHLKIVHSINKNFNFKVASPAKSDNSARSGTSSPSGTTRYCCPLKDCTFSTDKAGLLGGEAASHISVIHKVTAEAMKTAPKGYCKFKKVKAGA